MDWNRVNAWTTALYTLIHSLHIARAAKFGDLNALKDTLVDAGNWVPIVASYQSAMMPLPFGKSPVRFRRDPNTHFQQVVSQLIQMLLQDLVVIFDQMMDEALAARGEKAGIYPHSKVEKLATHLDKQFTWAKHGCIELIAVRNVLTHSSGQWNAKSIALVDSFVSPPPVVGERLVIGVAMLFQYRKAMRTFLNEVTPER
jgi:hypothetical protein